MSVDIVEKINDFFNNYDQEELSVDYVRCVPLENAPRLIWRWHTEDRANLASMLSICAHITNRIRFCSQLLAQRYGISYRRLEEYSKWVDLLRYTTRWIGYGKLVEITLTYRYVSTKKRWSRDIEIRLYLPFPIHFREYRDFLITHLGELESIGRAIIEYVYGAGLSTVMDFEEEKTLSRGVRLVTVEEHSRISREIAEKCYEVTHEAVSEPEYRYLWCNDVVKVSFSEGYYLAFDYRKRFGYNQNYCYPTLLMPSLNQIINVEEYVARWFRWW